MGITPSAMATAPLATQSRPPGGDGRRHLQHHRGIALHVVRTSFTLPQVSVALADWAPERHQRWVTLVSDYGPGINESSGQPAPHFPTAAVTREPCACRCNPDFAPFLQKVRDAKPDRTAPSLCPLARALR